MFAGVPCILREGHNYGYRYPYINSQTGCFASEEELPNKLIGMIHNYQKFSPRDWVLSNMSCQKAIQILTGAIRRTAIAAGENWTQEPTVKVCYLNTMRYWNDGDVQKFKADYDFLRSTVRK
jgi:hypothetical protein